MDDDKTLAKIVAAIFVAPTIIIAQVGEWLLWGWAVSKLWGWFLVPLGVPAITVLHGLGISMFMAVFKQYVPKQKEKGKDTSIPALIGEILGILLRPLLPVLVGWIVVQFM